MVGETKSEQEHDYKSVFIEHFKNENQNSSTTSKLEEEE